MTRDQALSILPEQDEDCDEPFYIPKTALVYLTAQDLPADIPISVSEFKDGAHHIEWDGHFYKEGSGLKAFCQFIWTRKYWDSPLGMPQYLDLVKRSIETRQRLQADIEFLDWGDDGAYINLSFRLLTLPSNLADANKYVVDQISKLEEGAEEAAREAGIISANIATRISGWGTTPLEELVEIVDRAKTSDEKGRSLEELVARLFSEINGMTVGGRVRTETEEIDIIVVNSSDDPRFRREEALILVECKNWTSKCGKNEFVIFKEKIENRKGRCSLGFLVSWNGFKQTVTKEMLRGSHERVLIVPIDGAGIRRAVRSSNPTDILLEAWTDAINT